MSSQTIEQRVAQLEQQMSLHDEEITKLTEQMIGTAEKPGVFESIRSMKISVDLLNENLGKLTKSVEKLAADRLMFSGVVIGVGMCGTLIGWLLRNFAR